MVVKYGLRCPFCDARVDYDRLPVVATNIPASLSPNLTMPTLTLSHVATRSGFGVSESTDHDEDSTSVGASGFRPRATVSIPSGSPILGWVGQWPVIRKPAAGPHDAGVSGSQRLRRALGVREDEPELLPQDLPAYICLRCKYPLPDELATHELYTVGVVGTLGSGKSHFLAAMALEATRRHGLAPFGVTEFAPNERTGVTFQERYYRRVFRQQLTLKGTPREDTNIRFQPLTFRVTVGKSCETPFRRSPADRQIALLFHDVSGEVLTNAGDRAAVAPFLRRADGLIFLVDPAALEPVRDWRERSGLADSAQAIDDYYQTDLLRACIDEIGEERLREMPVAIVLSKSDIVLKLLGQNFAFARPPSRNVEQWLKERNVIHHEVRRVLAQLGGTDLLVAARRIPNVTFHAVAAIGTEPDRDGRIGGMRPLRCVDPVAQVIMFLTN